MKIRRVFGTWGSSASGLSPRGLFSCAVFAAGLWALPTCGLAQGPGDGGPAITTLYYDTNGSGVGIGSHGVFGVWNSAVNTNRVWNQNLNGTDAGTFWENIPPLLSSVAEFGGTGDRVGLGADLVTSDINIRSNGYIFEINAATANRSVQGVWNLGNPSASNAAVGLNFRALGETQTLSLNRIQTAQGSLTGSVNFQTNGADSLLRVNINQYQTDWDATNNPVFTPGAFQVPVNITGGGQFNLVGNSAAVVNGAINRSGDGNTLHLGATAGNSLTLNGAINNGAANTVRFGVGATTVDGGSVTLGAGAKTWGDTIIDLGSTGLVRLNAGVSLPTGTNLSFASNSTLQLNGNNATIASLSSAAGVGNVRNGSNTGDPASRTLTINGAAETTFGGTIANGGTQALNLVRGGTGSTTLTGANTYSGSTSVTGGSLVIEGSNTGGSALSVSTGATLDVRAGGSIAAATTTINGEAIVNGLITSWDSTMINGTVSGGGAITTTGLMTVAAGGTLSPGNSIGELNITGDLSFVEGSFFNVDINQDALTADLLAVTGALDLGNATLTITDLGAVNNVIKFDTRLTIATFGTLTGEFVGLANNSTVIIGDNEWQISYGGSLANAITLSVVPEPSALLFVGSMVGLALVRRRR